MTINYTYYLIMLINTITFIIMGVDKLKAIKGKYRIPEKTLLILGFLFGGLGLFLGMRIFRHKTQKTLFRVLAPLYVFLQCLAILMIMKYFG